MFVLVTSLITRPWNARLIGQINRLAFFYPFLKETCSLELEALKCHMLHT